MHLKTKLYYVINIPIYWLESAVLTVLNSAELQQKFDWQAILWFNCPPTTKFDRNVIDCPKQLLLGHVLGAIPNFLLVSKSPPLKLEKKWYKYCVSGTKNRSISLPLFCWWNAAIGIKCIIQKIVVLRKNTVEIYAYKLWTDMKRSFCWLILAV